MSYAAHPEEVKMEIKLSGKGMFIYVLSYVEGGNPNVVLPADHSDRLAHAERIAAAAQAAGLTHVLIKVADGTLPYNRRRRREDGWIYFNSTLAGSVDDCPAVVRALQARGIQAWGWQYIYGVYPEAEADQALQRIAELGLDGFCVNAEVQFKKAGMDVPARIYMQRLSTAAQVPLAFSSFKFPTYHAPLPFKVFLDYVDINMPQVYPIGDTRPNAHTIQLERSLREYRAINATVPIVPTGGAFSQSWADRYGVWHPWVATPAQVLDFYQACEAAGLPAANLWDWYSAADRFPELWTAHADYAWQGALPEEVPPIGEGDPPPPIEEGDQVNIPVKVLANPHINIRPEPATAGAPIGKIAYGTTVSVVDLRRDAQRNLWGKTELGWIAQKYQGQVLTDLCV